MTHVIVDVAEPQDGFPVETLACHSPSEEVHSQADTEWASMPLVAFLPCVTAGCVYFSEKEFS